MVVLMSTMMRLGHSGRPWLRHGHRVAGESMMGSRGEGAEWWWW